MRKLFLAFALLGSLAHAGVLQSFKVTGTGGAPIPVAYSTSDAKSKVATGIAYADAKGVCIYNATSSVIAVNVDNGSSSTAPTADVQDIYLGAGMGYCEKMSVTSRVYIRSDSGSTITAGSVYGHIYN